MLRSQTGSGLRHAPTTLFFLGALTGFFGIWSLHAPSDQPFTTIVFRPDYGVDRVFSAIAAADARLVWSDSAMGVVIVSVDPGRKWEFYGHGALLISGVGVLAGCLNWTKV